VIPNCAGPSSAIGETAILNYRQKNWLENMQILDIEIVINPLRRFSVGRRAQAEAVSLAELMTWIEMHRLAAPPSPLDGYFYRRWTPAFLRRNEVQVQTAPGGGKDL
jgi:hypothetical protein